jgi:hypothetical protein
VRIRFFAGLAAAVLIALFGWHLWLRAEVVARVKAIPSVAWVDRAVPVEVRVDPFTNRVEVGLALAFASDPKDLLGKLGRSLGIGLAAEHWPGAIESELRELAGERYDLYAMIVPYRAVIVERGGPETSR